MNKNIFMILVIIFIVIVVMATAAYSCGIQEIDNGSEKQPYYDILVDLDTEYIGSQDWKVIIIDEEEKYPPKFKITEGQIDCQIISSENALPSRTAKRKIDGRIYCIESVSEGAAGTVYTQYTYYTIKNGSLIMVSCVIRYPQCMNYSEPQSRQTLIYHLIERFEGKFKRFFKLRPKGRPKRNLINRCLSLLSN